jgi:hypothetical protein
MTISNGGGSSIIGAWAPTYYIDVLGVPMSQVGLYLTAPSKHSHSHSHSHISLKLSALAQRQTADTTLCSASAVLGRLDSDGCVRRQGLRCGIRVPAAQAGHIPADHKEALKLHRGELPNLGALRILLLQDVRKRNGSSSSFLILLVTSGCVPRQARGNLERLSVTIWSAVLFGWQAADRHAGVRLGSNRRLVQ